MSDTLDLHFERSIDIAREKVWRAWTEPALLKHWFTPAPWRTVEAEVDLRAGGIFRTVMLSPEGQRFPNLGCCLEVVPNEKLVWTNAFGPGFRPLKPGDAEVGGCGPFVFTGIISLTAHGGGTLYKAQVLHADEAACKQHAAMGFQEGWGKALDQLVALMR